jgi:CHAT domain-containing protein
MEGLAWAFLSAGAGQVIASRYPVDDESTVTLMLALYRYLQDLPVAEALGRARDDCLSPPDELPEREVGAWAVWS